MHASSRLNLWVRAARPQTLIMAVSPIIAGIALSAANGGNLELVPLTAALIAALAIQVTTNLANDAADDERGHDGPLRIGPPRVTGQGLMTPREVRYAAMATTATAVVAGVVAVAYGGWPILGIGIAALVAAWTYSDGPVPISMTPFGEVFVVGFFGIAAVVGTVHLAGGSISVGAFALGVAIGLPAAAVLLVNNHRDRVADAANGRRTLAILVGVDGSRVIYASFLATSVILCACVVGAVSGSGALVVAAASLPAVWLIRRLASLPVGPALNGLVAYTARFQLLLALLVALGLAVA